MNKVRIGLTEEGSGEPVVLLHCSASTKRQWRPLIGELKGQYRVFAMDLYGYGETPFPESPEGFHLGREVELVEQVLELAGTPAHLVGHSYGGAVALKTALRHPERVRSATVHEPSLFSLLRIHGQEEPWREIRGLCDGIEEHVRSGSNDLAAELFIDYFSVAGTWAAMTESRKAPLEHVTPKVVLDFTALFADEESVETYAGLRMPVQVTVGTTSPAPSRAVAELLASVLGPARVLEAAGHMAPTTHGELFHAAVREHFKRSG